MQFFRSPLKSVHYGLCIIVSVLLLVSCGEESKLTRHIPKDVAGVFAMDIKSLALKSMDVQEILKLENLQKMFESSDDSVGKAIRNSGIDFLNKAYVFGKSTTPGEGYGAVVVALSDATAFEAFVKKVNDGAEVAESNGFKTSALDETVMVAWNETEAIVVIAKENGKETLATLTSLKKDDAIAGNVPTFDELEKQEADISFWLNMDALQTLVPQTPYGATTTGMNMKDTYMTATCNFEDGQIAVDSKYMTNDEMTKKFNFMKSTVKSDVIETLPGTGVIGVLGFGIDMQKLAAYLDSEKLLETYDPLVQQSSGLTAKEALEMFDGDAAFSVNGAVMKEVKRLNYSTGEEYLAQEPEFDFSAVLGIANKETAAKLLTHLVDAGMLTKEDNFYSIQGKMFIVEKGNAYVITNTEARRKAIVDGNGEKLNSELTGLFSSNAAAMYINTNNIPAEFLTGQNAMFGTHLGNLEIEDMTYTSSAVKDNVTTGRFVIRFKAKDENSLITISKITKKYGEIFAPPVYTVPTDGTEVIEEEAATEEAEADAGQE